MRKYVNGYLPKIEYWQTKWQEAIESNNIPEAVKAAKKVTYFIGRQEEVYSREQEQLKAYDGQLRGDALLKAIGFFEKSSK